VTGSGDYNIAIGAFGYEAWAATGASVTKDEVATWDAGLTPFVRAALSGRVVASGSGQVIRGAAVTLAGASPPLADQTDAAGAYDLADVPNGSHVLHAPAAGYAARQAVDEVNGPLVAVPDIELVPTADYGVYTSGAVRQPTTGSTPPTAARSISWGTRAPSRSCCPLHLPSMTTATAR
jgi:hypothetical protein